MTGRVFTCDHRVFDLPEPVAWNVTYTGSVPCDSFFMTVVYRPEMREVFSKAAGFAAIEKGVTMLRGIVDEYTVQLSAQGMTATIRGRGYAARLLDNESRPLTYEAATLAEIVRNHVTPYGVECERLAKLRASSTYTVAAGSSQWKALEGFCRTFGGFSPRFSKEGKLIAAPLSGGREVVIGDQDAVISCTLREDHYGVLTEVLVIDKTRNLSYSVQNRDMIEKGGQCRRVVYTPGRSTWDAMRYTGEYQIKKSRQEEKQVTLCLPGSFPAFPGDTVRLELSALGAMERLRVYEAENRFSSDKGAVSVLTLREDI